MKGKRTAIFIVSLGLCLALIAPVGVAWGYFTSYVTTRGSLPISLGTQTEITEDFSNWTKSISVSNQTGSSPVFIRVKAFSGSNLNLSYDDRNEGLWNLDADGYWYYANPVDPGSSTSILKVIIGGAPSDAKENDEFNVVVVYESTLALYDANGKPYANWDTILDSGNAKGGDAA